MRILFYSTHNFERPHLEEAGQAHEAVFLTESLSLQTAYLAMGFEAISIFSQDDASADVLQALYKEGIRYISIRSTGYDNIDIEEAINLGIQVANVPAFSSHAVAEHTLCLLLTLARKITVAQEQVQQHNFTIDDLIGFNLYGKKIGLIGTGKIGASMAGILHGLGCTILAYDLIRNQHLENRYNVFYVGLYTLYSMADIILLHVPLTKDTYHLVNRSAFRRMKKGVILINTSRGAVIDTEALIENLESRHVAAAALDVYEKERSVFYKDLSFQNLQDTHLLKLLSFKNVILTPHIGFATQETIAHTARTTFHNFTCWETNRLCENQVTYGLQKEFATDNNKSPI